MNYSGSYGRFLLMLAILPILSGCVKDIDFYQAEEISLSPDLQVDLLIYNVEEEYFGDEVDQDFKTVIRDTVRLEFLDDAYIQDDLSQVEFSFKHKNAFSQSFYHTIKFLAPNGRKQISFSYELPSGSPGNPVETEFVELIGEDRIHLIRNSIQMVVELEMQPNDEEISGALDFASKGLFMFEF